MLLRVWLKSLVPVLLTTSFKTFNRLDACGSVKLLLVPVLGVIAHLACMHVPSFGEEGSALTAELCCSGCPSSSTGRVLHMIVVQGMLERNLSMERQACMARRCRLHTETTGKAAAHVHAAQGSFNHAAENKYWCPWSEQALQPWPQQAGRSSSAVEAGFAASTQAEPCTLWLSTSTQVHGRSLGMGRRGMHGLVTEEMQASY